MTYLPDPNDPYGPTAQESCEVCHGAGTDFSPDKVQGKIPSDRDTLKIVLKRNPKLIDKMARHFVVGFKAQAGMDVDGLVKESVALIKRSGCKLVVANSMENVRPGRTKVVVVDKDGLVDKVEGAKAQVADRIIDVVVRSMA